MVNQVVTRGRNLNVRFIETVVSPWVPNRLPYPYLYLIVRTSNVL